MIVLQFIASADIVHAFVEGRVLLIGHEQYAVLNRRHDGITGRTMLGTGGSSQRGRRGRVAGLMTH